MSTLRKPGEPGSFPMWIGVGAMIYLWVVCQPNVHIRKYFTSASLNKYGLLMELSFFPSL